MMKKDKGSFNVISSERIAWYLLSHEDLVGHSGQILRPNSRKTATLRIRIVLTCEKAAVQATREAKTASFMVISWVL